MPDMMKSDCMHAAHLPELPPMMATQAEANDELLLIIWLAAAMLPDSEGMRAGPCTSASTHLKVQAEFPAFALPNLYEDLWGRCMQPHHAAQHDL